MSRAVILAMSKKKTSHIFHFIMCVLLGLALGIVGVLGWLCMWFLCVLSNMLENWKIDRKIEVELKEESGK